MTPLVVILNFHPLVSETDERDAEKDGYSDSHSRYELPVRRLQYAPGVLGRDHGQTQHAYGAGRRRRTALWTAEHFQ